MTYDLLLGLASVVVLGTAAQWLGWRLRLPSILLLLLFGFAAGPAGVNVVRPDALFGPLLLPLVSLSVAVILFEGGLSLHVRELGDHAKVVRRLVTLGVFVTWVVASAAAYLLGGLDARLAVLFGAIVTVSGPTVVLPLLRQIRPTGAAASILKWEGIVNDPIGAMLAVLVFQGIVAEGLREATWGAVGGIVKTVVVGGVLGFLAALLVLELLKRYWVPDALQSPVVLAVCWAAFAGANTIQHESGLLAVTLMGVLLANQKRVSTRHILEFKENLRTLLISGLFILLAARLDFDDLRRLGAGDFLLLGVLLAVRPLVVLLCTRGAGLGRADKIFLAGMAPRGIVAAAVVSVFAIRLQELGHEGADRLVPMVFLVIFGTVTVYGLCGRPLAIRLGLATTEPQGVLLLGAHSWARALGVALRELDLAVVVVDTNPRHIAEARMEGLRAYRGSALGEHADEQIDLRGVGRLFALTPNDEVNALTAIHYAHLFGSGEVYQVVPEAGRESFETVPSHLRGRFLFADKCDFTALRKRFQSGQRVKATAITEEFDYAAWRTHYGDDALPLLTVDASGRVTVGTPQQPLEPEAGDTLVALVDEESEAAAHRKGAKSAKDTPSRD